jgi:hypothetical protein
MSNFKDILVQIIDVIGLPAWRDQDIEDFLGIAEVEAMMDLLELLPKDKQAPIMKKMIAPKKTPQDIEQMFGRYYTPAQMQEAVVTRMKKQITQHIVHLLDAPLTHAKRERVYVLLEQLSFRK